MRNALIYRLCAACLFLFIHMSCFASIDVYDFENEQNRADFVLLTKELRCPKCQNQDIADSNAPIAADMRREVHRLLKEGKNKESIVDFMVDRFGEFVTYNPKKTTETFMLWYGPWFLVVIGIIVILSLIKMNKNGNNKQEVSSQDVNKILAKYDSDK